MKHITFFCALFIALSVQAAPLKKSVTWENICAHKASLPYLGQVETTPSNLDRPSYWSVGCETLDRDYAVFDNFVQYMGQTGVGYSRLQSGWAKSEPKKGKYNFEWLDHHVDGLLEQGIHPWLCLCYGNPIYSTTGDNLNAGIFGDGPVMDAWLAYVRQVVKRYKGKVGMYEVWNEPDGAKAANGVKGESWREYANLFARTSAVIREVDPDAKIAAFGAYSIASGYFKNGLEEIKRLGGLDNIDYVTYHAYWYIPERIIPKVKELKTLCHQMNPKIQVLQGECGCPAQLEYGHAMCNFEWTEYSQAKWDLRHTLINFALGVPSSIFTMVDLNYGWMLQSYGLIRMNLKSEPQYLRPKFHAVQHLTSVFTSDVKPDDSVTFSDVNTGLPIFFKGVQKQGKACGFLIWMSGDKPSDSLERRNINITVKNLDIKEPVYVDMLTGAVHSLEGTFSKSDKGVTFKYLPVWDSPVLIMEKAQVNIAK